jgi:hypothetical protein
MTDIKLKSPEPTNIKNKNNEKNSKNEDMTEIKKKNIDEAIMILEKIVEDSTTGYVANHESSNKFNNNKFKNSKIKITV